MLDTEFYPFKSLLAALLLLLPLTMLAQESGSSTVEADFLARGEYRYGGLAGSAAAEYGNSVFDGVEKITIKK